MFRPRQGQPQVPPLRPVPSGGFRGISVPKQTRSNETASPLLLAQGPDRLPAPRHRGSDLQQERVGLSLLCTRQRHPFSPCLFQPASWPPEAASSISLGHVFGE